MEKRWVVRERGETAVVRQLAAALGVTDSLANLMSQRTSPQPRRQKLSSAPVSITCMILS
jgi:hypothetical protein